MSLAGLLQAPMHVGIEGLKNSVDGKKVAIVGNASSLFGRTLGQEIDDHDIVIRLNRGMVKLPSDQGTRTDIIGTARPLDCHQILDIYKARRLMWLFYRWWRIPTWTPEIWNITEIIPLQLWYDAYKKLRVRPTSGFVMLNLLLHHSKPAHLTLYGFDFYDTPNFYRLPATIRQVHSPEMEKALIHGILQLRNDVSLK